MRNFTTVKNYDYIISGAGASGLSLLMRMLQHPWFAHKKILVVDKAPKTQNDRTWCFWEQQPGIFEPVVHHQWQQVNFYANHFSELLNLYPYHYKMIRGIDFYNYVTGEAAKNPNITFRYGQVEALGNEGTQALLILDGERLTADYVFNSIMFAPPQVPTDKYYLLQHFKGWLIETPAPAFNPAEATLMDFRVSQQHGTTFVYVLPLSPQKALVEYTLFTPNTLPPEEYDIALRAYISQYLKISEYHVAEEEFGIIPMTNIKFEKGIGRVINMGTAGGQTKASSGYTFQFIQKKCAAIINNLVQNIHPQIPENFIKGRFKLYDSTLLNVLYNNKMGGDEVFARMFEKNDAARVLRFLDNESSLEDEINIMSSVPTGIFMKAAFEEMMK